MTKKQLLRIAAFALAFFAMVYVLCDLFECENTTNYDMRFASYRNSQKNTVDAVYFGSSGVDRYWMPAKAYEKYGMVVYPLSSDAMPSWLYVEMIEEAFAYQNPQLLIVDIRPFTQSVTDANVTDVRARRVLDAMSVFSLNRLKVAWKSLKMMQQIDSTRSLFDMSYFFSFIKYHSSWSGKSFRFKNNLGNEEHAFGGFFLSEKLSVKSTPQTPVLYDDYDVIELDPVSENALYELLDYAEEKGLQLLFVDTPQFKAEREGARAKRVYEILDAEGCDYVAYYMAEQECPNKGSILTLNMDPEKDFYDKGHANYYGAEKFTEVFAKYLDEHYDLPDRRQDEKVSAEWDGLYTAIKDQIVLYEDKLPKTETTVTPEEPVVDQPVDGAPVVDNPAEEEVPVVEEEPVNPNGNDGAPIVDVQGEQQAAVQ